MGTRLRATGENDASVVRRTARRGQRSERRLPVERRGRRFAALHNQNRRPKTFLRRRVNIIVGDGERAERAMGGGGVIVMIVFRMSGGEKLRQRQSERRRDKRRPCSPPFVRP